MGFDLHGTQPTSPSGYYFRAHFAEWPRLWALVELTCADFLSPEDIEGGKVNDGYHMASAKAEQIDARLTELLSSEEPGHREALEGATAQGANISSAQRILEHMKRRGFQPIRWVPTGEPGEYEGVPEDIAVPEDAGQYSFSWELVREFAEFCRASGGFTIH